MIAISQNPCPAYGEADPTLGRQQRIGLVYYAYRPLIVLVMVGVEELASLDFVLWRRTGKQAARALDCNQSTISRRLGRCLEVFQLKRRRRRNEWDVPFSHLLQL